MSKAPHRIGLPPNLRALYIERYAKEQAPLNLIKGSIIYKQGYWLLPLSTNPNRTLGEFLKLYDNGKIERITLRENDDDACVEIKPEDSK